MFGVNQVGLRLVLKLFKLNFWLDLNKQVDKLDTELAKIYKI